MSLYTPILVLGAIAAGFAVVSVVIALVIGPRRFNRAKLEAYECGIEPVAGETIGPGVEVGHVPMGADRTYWFATERVAEGRRSQQGELAYLRDKFAAWADPVPAGAEAAGPGDEINKAEG